MSTAFTNLLQKYGKEVLGRKLADESQLTFVHILAWHLMYWIMQLPTSMPSAAVFVVMRKSVNSKKHSDLFYKLSEYIFQEV
jgi:hypothetical protein